MSKTITFNIFDSYEISPIFSNLDIASSSIEVNINVTPTKRTYDQLYEDCGSSKYKQSCNSSSHQHCKSQRYNNDTPKKQQHNNTNSTQKHQNNNTINSTNNNNNNNNVEVNNNTTQSQNNNNNSQHTGNDDIANTNEEEDNGNHDTPQDNQNNNDNQVNYGTEEEEEEIDIIQRPAKKKTHQNVQHDEVSNLNNNVNLVKKLYTETQLKQLMEDQITRSADEYKKDKNNKYQESLVIYNLKDSQIQSIVDYLNKFKLVCNGCHILPPNVEKVEMIGRFMYYRLNSSEVIKINLLYWYINALKKDLIKCRYQIENRCPNSYCFNPEHIIAEVEKVYPRGECFKNNAQILYKFNHEVKRIEENDGEADQDEIRKGFSKFKCRHRIKCICEFAG